jgi:hypothetical protein
MRIKLGLLVLSQLLAAPAWAGCVDLPSQGILFEKAALGVVESLGSPDIARIKLDCSLTEDEWAKVHIPLHLCTEATLTKPGGGQCKVIDATAITERPSGYDFETVIRRKFP